jgi:hypothetical protein
MNPRGAHPQAVTSLDDCLFDAQCSADSQQMNTETLLQFMDRADDDGVIDADEWRYIFRHVRLENRLNEEQCSLLKWGRVHCNAVVELVERLRGQIQECKVAMRPQGVRG